MTQADPTAVLEAAEQLAGSGTFVLERDGRRYIRVPVEAWARLVGALEPTGGLRRAVAQAWVRLEPESGALRQ